MLEKPQTSWSDWANDNHKKIEATKASSAEAMSKQRVVSLDFLTMRAHQYLYYVECRPILSDYDYDRFCKEHNLHGGGGSDRASDYSAEEIACAQKLANAPVSHAPSAQPKSP